MGEPVDIERTKRKLRIHIYGCDQVDTCTACEFQEFVLGRFQCSLNLGKTLAEAVDAIDQLKAENDLLNGSTQTENAEETAQALTDLLVWIPWAVQGEIRCGDLRPKMETIREAAELLRKVKPRGDSAILPHGTGRICSMCAHHIQENENFCGHCGRRLIEPKHKTEPKKKEGDQDG